jgi:hypothetical protein
MLKRIDTPTYKTSDGKSFDKYEEAMAHERFEHWKEVLERMCVELDISVPVYQQRAFVQMVIASLEQDPLFCQHGFLPIQKFLDCCKVNKLPIRSI